MGVVRVPVRILVEGYLEVEADGPRSARSKALSALFPPSMKHLDMVKGAKAIDFDVAGRKKIADENGGAS